MSERPLIQKLLLEAAKDDRYANQFWGKPRLNWMLPNGDNEKLKSLPPFDSRKIYRSNNYGFRSDDFNTPAQLLFAGCSWTYGSGLDEEFIWGNMLAKKLDMTAANIGISGASWEMIVDSILGYIEEIGHVPYVVCLFPDFYRYTFPVDGNFISLEKSSELEGTTGYAENFFSSVYPLDFYDKNYPRIVKRPFNPEHVFSQEMAIYQSFKAVRRLEEFCQSREIDLKWTTWNPAAGEVIDRVGQTREDLKFNFYFSSQPYGIYAYFKETNNFRAHVHTNSYGSFCTANHAGTDCSCYLICHLEEEKQYESSRQFHHALDIEQNFQGVHPGIHTQLHILEAFLDQF